MRKHAPALGSVARSLRRVVFVARRNVSAVRVLIIPEEFTLTRGVRGRALVTEAGGVLSDATAAVSVGVLVDALPQVAGTADIHDRSVGVSELVHAGCFRCVVGAQRVP